MIISHKYRFIFIKTLKTAGTSLEIALSKFLGENDIVTPLHKNDEDFRKSLGHVSAQNYHLKWPNWNKRDYKYFFNNFRPHYFGGHASAKFIKSHISKEIWNSYYKFCFDRNPWDKIISLYYWQNRNHKVKPAFEKYFNQVDKRKLSNYRKYSVNNEVVVDKVYKFEDLKDSLIDIQKKLKLPQVIDLPYTKHCYKNQAKSITWNDSQIELVKEICQKEIELLNYNFNLKKTYLS